MNESVEREDSGRTAGDDVEAVVGVGELGLFVQVADDVSVFVCLEIR